MLTPEGSVYWQQGWWLTGLPGAAADAPGPDEGPYPTLRDLVAELRRRDGGRRGRC